MMRMIITKPDGAYEVYGWNGADFIQAPQSNSSVTISLGLAMSAITLLLVF